MSFLKNILFIVVGIICSALLFSCSGRCFNSDHQRMIDDARKHEPASVDENEIKQSLMALGEKCGISQGEMQDKSVLYIISEIKSKIDNNNDPFYGDPLTQEDKRIYEGCLVDKQEVLKKIQKRIDYAERMRDKKVFVRP